MIRRAPASTPTRKSASTNLLSAVEESSIDQTIDRLNAHAEPNLNGVVYHSLRPLSLWLGCLIFILSGADTLLHFKIRGLVLTIGQFCFPASLFVLYLALGRFKVAQRYANSFAALIAFIILASCFVPPDFLHDPFATWAIGLVMVGAGCFVLSPFWLSLVLASALAAWLGLTLVLAPHSDWTAAAFMNFAAASLALVIRRIHVQALWRAERNAAALRFSEERFRKIVENSTDALALISPTAIVLDAGQSVERVLGYRPGDLIGINAFELAHPDDVEQTQHALMQAIRQPRVPVRHECRARTAKGEWIAVESFITNLVDEPSVKAIVVNFRDVSERRRAEEHLRRAMVAAEAANHAKTQFLANMSHEIRTPMNGVLGMTNLLLTTPLTEEQHEYASMAKSSADSLLTVIDEILDFSKVEAGKLVLEPIEFNLVECARLAVKLQALRAQEKQLNLSLEIDSGIPDRVIGDPNRLRQVITNLIGNAIKFTERGIVSVLIDIDSTTTDTIKIHFEVRDSGIGIPEDKQETIFEPFAQADGSTARKFGGTGLGLTICSRLVEKMGGRIWVESVVGEGSHFHFSAVFGVNQPSPYPHPSNAPSLAWLSSATARDSISEQPLTSRVLLAEDNVVNQTVARRILEKQGHIVTVVADGIAALDALRHAKYDIVLMDVQMPSMDGVEATTRIRTMEQSTGHHTPVIAMTAHAMQSDRDRCLAAGMDDYLSKPIEASQLLEAIQNCRRRQLVDETMHTAPDDRQNATPPYRA